MDYRCTAEKSRIRITYELFFILVLLLYPLRHMNIGLDLWDTGYSYANFLYMGTDHMDPMWLFSTYLTNVVGHFLTVLPGGETLLGLNFYTGLFASALALIGYFFCTRRLGIPKGITFLGEFMALSLCWCPTGSFYNYLTYLFFLLGVLFLYLGLAQQRWKYLFVAGIMLGINVFVRFSNLAEAAMIVGVWAYAVIEGLEERKAEQKTLSQCLRGIWSKIWRNTLWCLAGYLAAVLVLFGYISIRYGAGEYIQGIMRLFAMTEGATDYKPTAMLYSLFQAYIINLYWFVRICFFGVVAFAFYNVIRWLGQLAWRLKCPSGIISWVKWIARILCVIIGFVMLVWLYKGEFYSFYYNQYHSMLGPSIIFLMVTMVIAAIRIFTPGVHKEEKLISGLVILVIIFTSLGSNNGVYPSINNLFVAAPYFFWQFWKMCVEQKQVRIWKISVDLFPVKAVLAVLMLMILMQSIGFGTEFVFVEAHGAQETVAQVENNPVLKGIKMSPERAQWMEEITDYVNEQKLQGQEVILFGGIPALSFYLQMPSSFNPWSDLESYTYATMQESMEVVAREVRSRQKDAPVIIVERNYLERENKETSEKWQLIVNFMEEFAYQQTFANEKFVIFER